MTQRDLYASQENYNAASNYLWTLQCAHMTFMKRRYARKAFTGAQATEHTGCTGAAEARPHSWSRLLIRQAHACRWLPTPRPGMINSQARKLP